jgi:uncharacterized protein YraI
MQQKWGTSMLAALFFAGCGGPVAHDDGDPDVPIGGIFGASFTDEDAGGPSAILEPGATARVTAVSLNLRDGAGTTATVLTAMPCGATVDVLGGPSTTPAGWWNVSYGGQSGWAAGQYLVPEASFDAALCPGGVPSSGAPAATTVADMLARAQQAVGYSYFWGHGAWRADHAQLGTCSGSCPSCTHDGTYGADCSGFVAKIWQVPAASAPEADEHPYSTYNFYNETTHWQPVPRSSLQPGDAVVRRDATSGHIALVEVTTDPYGQLWLYEARGCSTGVTHDLRTVDSTYIAIRRDGL